MTLVSVQEATASRDCSFANCPETAESGTDRCRRHRAAPENLAEFAEAAKREHVATTTAIGTAIEHGVACGAALLAARPLVAKLPVTWADWLTANVGITRHYAYGYMRLAHHKDELPAEVFEPFRDARNRIRQPSLGRAMKAAAKLPPVYGGQTARTPDETRAEVVRLRDAGLNLTDIADRVDVAPSTVGGILNPEQAARRATRVEEAAQATRAADQAALRAALSRAPSEVAEAHSALGRVIDLLDQPAYQPAQGLAKAARGRLERIVLEAGE